MTPADIDKLDAVVRALAQFHREPRPMLYDFKPQIEAAREVLQRERTATDSADLELENRLMRARNERLERELAEAKTSQVVSLDAALAAEYMRWIDFYHAGSGDYADFLRATLVPGDEK